MRELLPYERLPRRPFFLAPPLRLTESVDAENDAFAEESAVIAKLSPLNSTLAAETTDQNVR